MKRHAVALRAFTHADDAFAQDQVILGMEPGQFNDWSAEGVGLVREATAAEVAKAKGVPAAAAKKAAPARKPRPKASAVKVPAPVAIPPAEPVTDDTTPSDPPQNG